MTDIFKVPMLPHDTGAKTVGEFMCFLLNAMWYEGDGFSGKRPFGNSDWQYYVYASIVEAGLMEAEKDEWGWWRWTGEEEHRVDALLYERMSEVLR